MRYQIIDEHYIVPVQFVDYAGLRTANPPDAMVDELGRGFPYEPSSPPEFPDENDLNYYIERTYELRNGVIVDVWTLADQASEAGTQEAI